MRIKSFSAGLAAAFAAWGILTLADCFDEFVLDQDSYVGIFIFLTIPIAMTIIYIIHFLKKKPGIKNLISWFIGYTLLFLPVWLYICSGNYFFPQKSRSSWLDLNGIEYLFYGWTAYCAFLVLCAVFHMIFFIVKKIRSKKNSPDPSD